MIREWLAIAIGGMLGTLIRHAVSSGTRGMAPSLLPFATLAVNVAGCFAIGWLVTWAGQREQSGTWPELAIRVGLLGGLTTFSTFGLEVVQTWQSRPGLAVALAAGHLVLGLAAVCAGMALRAH